MKSYMKGSIKVFLDYLIVLFVFLVFLVAGFVNIKIYSVIMVLLAYSLFYSDFKTLAVKERKPQSKVKVYPARGLVYGVIGSLPLAVLWILHHMTLFDAVNSEKLKNGLMKLFFGPLYGMVSPQLWILISIPVLVALGYLAGYYNFSAAGKFLKPRNAGTVKKK